MTTTVNTDLPPRIDWLHACGQPFGLPCPDLACPHKARCTPTPNPNREEEQR